jgi:hypothetical protein
MCEELADPEEANASADTRANVTSMFRAFGSADPDVDERQHPGHAIRRRVRLERAELLGNSGSSGRSTPGTCQASPPTGWSDPRRPCRRRQPGRGGRRQARGGHREAHGDHGAQRGRRRSPEPDAAWEYDLSGRPAVLIWEGLTGRCEYRHPWCIHLRPLSCRLGTGKTAGSTDRLPNDQSLGTC